MFKSVDRIKDFGVFQDYSNTVAIDEFAEKNIIYGWNYSGKTTISRIFSCLEHKKKHQDYPNADFTLKDAAGNSWKPVNLETCPKIVRVFNSDFISHNLSWNGESFNPILLLGEESIEAQTKIESNKEKITKCQIGESKKQTLITQKQSELKQLKTQKAKQIKSELGISEAFDSRHLDNLITSAKDDPTKYLVTDNTKFIQLKTNALSSEADKLPIQDKISVSTEVGKYDIRIKNLLESVPELSETIQYLKENPEIANWVDRGLSIHEGKEKCEFCGNSISTERFQSIRAHFSEDLKKHKSEILQLKNQIHELKIAAIELHERDFYENHRVEFKTLKEQLATQINDYNKEINRIEKLLSNKHDNPFNTVENFKSDTTIQTKIDKTIENINIIIAQNNKLTNEFTENKTKAFNYLKRHYVAEFLQETDLDEHDKTITRLTSHADRYKSIKTKLSLSIKELEATISKAQNGREQINKLISRLLGRDEISIEVINEISEERFRLTRSGKVAKNLSEGEKTAIAFSFFLTKLLELPTLDDAVVYIDDPISSLDSNHVFQINSILKTHFFYQDGGVGGEWKLRCKQLFVSTHNFEFFSLLKELPLGVKKSRYYLVKRIEVAKSTLTNLPESIKNYSSEYHYLFNVIYKFHELPDKSDLEVLLAIPNALRRFLEIYTYAKMPTFSKATVDQRADRIFGAEESKRILKVLHYFSHLNNIDRLVSNSDLISDIENVVNDVINHLKNDTMHYEALLESVT